MRSFFSLIVILILFSSSSFAQRYELVWSDEFNEAELDTDTWNLWNGTAYNNEDQYYTPRDKNAYTEDGNLYIVGLRENYGGREWTSARLESQNNFEFQYGKVEIRAKLPAGKGLWPAFWMLGSNIDDSGIGWPYSGEVDIMEYRGHLPAQTNGTIHFSAVEPDFPRTPQADRRLIGTEYDLPSGSFAEDFHLYQFEWSDSLMVWYIDDVEFFRLTKEEIMQRTSYYPFDQPFFFILNLAIGGDFLGTQQPDATTPNRNEVIVDYVRVYQDANIKPDISVDFEDRVDLDPLDTIQLEAEVTDPDGSVEKVEFYLNGVLFSSFTEAPYSTEWRPGIDGCYEFEVKAYDNENGVGFLESSTVFDVGTGCEQRPFENTPQTFPGTVQLENYDYGGQGISYYDSTPDTNLGNGQGNTFRTTEAVDIIPDENEENNFLITETTSGEWAHYQLEVEQAGLYDIEFRSVAGNQSGRVNFTLDGEDWVYFTRIIEQTDEYYSTKIASDVELAAGVYDLRMEIAIDGNGLKPDHLKAIFKESTSTETKKTEKPSSVELNQNYPNPFNPSTNISFELSSAQFIELEVYNSLGQKVETIHSGKLNNGTHQFTFNANTLSSGLYYYTLTTDKGFMTRKMLLLK